jgi:hypothetical protein
MGGDAVRFFSYGMLEIKLQEEAPGGCKFLRVVVQWLL